MLNCSFIKMIRKLQPRALGQLWDILHCSVLKFGNQQFRCSLCCWHFLVNSSKTHQRQRRALWEGRESRHCKFQGFRGNKYIYLFILYPLLWLEGKEQVQRVTRGEMLASQERGHKDREELTVLHHLWDLGLLGC